MYIYKISNKINNKVYIGQTINPIMERFHRHVNDAINGVLDTHFARAIRLYGPENFSIEQIDTATTQEELTQKEHDWIVFYNSIEDGYNETDAMNKSGGNTYKSKTPQEMEIIRRKLSDSKMGGKNPHSTKVKCKNIETDKELFFDSMAEAAKYFQLTSHQPISRRCRGEITNLFNGKWMFAYQNNEYSSYTALPNAKRTKQVRVTNLNTNDSAIFNTGNDADRYCHFGIGYTSKKLKKYQEFIRDNYKIVLLN